jgi:hypothetical protein
LQLFMLLPVKHSFTMSNILIDKMASMIWFWMTRGYILETSTGSCILQCESKSMKITSPWIISYLTLANLKQARKSLFIFLLTAYLSVCYWVKSASMSPNDNQLRENRSVMMNQ